MKLMFLMTASRLVLPEALGGGVLGADLPDGRAGVDVGEPGVAGEAGRGLDGAAVGD